MAIETKNQSNEKRGLGLERRSFPRREAKAKVFCRLDKWGMTAPIEGILLDVSQDGACIVLPKTVEKGAEIELEFVGFGSKSEIKVQACVRMAEVDESARTCKIGCHFERRLSYDQLSKLVR